MPSKHVLSTPIDTGMFWMRQAAAWASGEEDIMKEQVICNTCCMFAYPCLGLQVLVLSGSFVVMAQAQRQCLEECMKEKSFYRA